MKPFVISAKFAARSVEDEARLFCTVREVGKSNHYRYCADASDGKQHERQC
jgi:hypothetical protein